MRPLAAVYKSSLDEALRGYETSVVEITPYLEARGIDQGTAERMRLGFASDPPLGHEQFLDRLVIPSLGWDGLPYALKFRCMQDHDCREAGCPKYLGLSQGTRLFNIRAIHEAGEMLCVTEGEIDAITLEQCGYHAVGVPGATNWKAHHPRMLAGFDTVLVFGDGDNAGTEFAKRVCDSLATATSIRLPEGEDINSIYVSGGKEAIDDLTGGDYQ